MRKLLALLPLLLLLNTPALFSQGIRVGVMDLERIVAQSASGKALQAQLENFQNTVKAQVDGMYANIYNKTREIQENSASMTPEQINSANAQIDQMRSDMQRFIDDKQREGQKMQQEGLKKIEQSLEPVVKQLVEELRLDLVLNNTPGIVIHFSARIDLTERVLQRF